MVAARVGVVLLVGLCLVGSVQGDAKGCIQKIISDCQDQAMAAMVTEDKEAAGEALKECALGSGTSSLCDGVIDDEGQPTQKFKDEMKACGAKAMFICPRQMFSLMTSAQELQTQMESGGKLDPTALKASLGPKMMSAFQCIADRQNRLPENCQILSQKQIEEAKGMIGDSKTKQDEKDENHEEKTDKKDKGGGMLTTVVVVLVIAAAAGGITYYVMKRRGQAQTLQSQLEMEQAPTSNAQVAVQGIVIQEPPICTSESGGQSYTGVPTNTNMKSDLSPTSSGNQQQSGEYTSVKSEMD